MLLLVGLQSDDVVEQLGVSLEEVWPGHDERRPELTRGDVEQPAGGAVAAVTEAGVVRVLLGSPKHV